MKRIEKKSILLLQICMFIYSLNTLFAKFASNYNFFSKEFIVLYGIGILFLMLYAILWQQVLKVLPLNTAFSNKGITVIWGLIWGVIIFKERITIKMIVASLMIIFGVYMVMSND